MTEPKRGLSSEVLAYIRDHPEGITNSDIRKALGAEYKPVCNSVKYLKRLGLIKGTTFDGTNNRYHPL
jgi:DNA-binding Lrp family transcriptional regulator